MKTLRYMLFAAVAAIAAPAVFAAAFDLKVSQQNSGGTAWIDRIFAPQTGAAVTSVGTFGDAIGMPWNKPTAKSADFTVATTDKGKIFMVTTGASTITATLPAAATAGTSWYVIIRKVDAGAGVVVTSPATVGLAVNGHTVVIYTDGASYFERTYYGGLDGSGALTISTGNSQTITFKPNGTTALTLSSTAVTTSLPILAPSGTAAAPSYSFTGDATKGWYSSGANEVSLSLAGVQAWDFQSGVILSSAGAEIKAANGSSAGLNTGSSGTAYLKVNGSDTFTSSTASGVAITAIGTNKSITVTPSGTGLLSVPIGTNTIQIIGGASAVTPGFAVGSGTTGRALTFLTGASGGAVIFDSASGSFLDFATDSRANILSATGSSGGASQMRLMATGHLLFASQTTDQTGVAQFPAGSADKTSGFGFANDTFLYRPAANKLAITAGSATDSYFEFYNNTTRAGYIQSNGTTEIVIQGAASAAIYTGGSKAVGYDGSQNQFQLGTTTVYHGSATGAVNSAAQLVKSVTAIANNTATDVLTVTIPNAAHSALLRIELAGSLGAGGAIGANEATGVVTYYASVTRTAGLATVTTFSSSGFIATSSVAGAATITVTAAPTAMSGATSATQTFTVQVTIARGSGSSTNHTCQVKAEVINANASGITIS